MTVLAVLTLVFAGLLAGEELVVRWGVAPAIRTLPDPAHLRTRIALVRRLRVLVPLLIVPSVLTTVSAAVALRLGPLGWTAVVVLVVFVATSAVGTVPLNIQVNDWDPDAPPPDWRAVVARWEAIDVLRSSTAIVAFVVLVLALV